MIDLTDTGGYGKRVSDHVWIVDVLKDVLTFAKNNELFDVVRILEAPCQDVELLFERESHLQHQKIGAFFASATQTKS